MGDAYPSDVWLSFHFHSHCSKLQPHSNAKGKVRKGIRLVLQAVGEIVQKVWLRAKQCKYDTFTFFSLTYRKTV